MLKSLLSLCFIIYLFGLVQPAVAQEEDPFADYSHLWEDKKKKKKKKKKEEQIDQVTVEETSPTETAPTPQTFVADTVAPSEPEINTYAADSIPPDNTVSEPVQEPQPEIEEPEPEEELAEDLTEEEEKPKKEKKVRENRDLPPVQDFRAGIPSGENKGSFTGGFTFTEIDGQYYVGLVLSPEFSLGKVGLGLNVPVLYGIQSNSFRTEIFKDGVGVARLIRYLRLGNQKRDPIYFRVGELSSAMIGFGGLINNYTNTTSYEKRKLGIHYDLNYRGLVGIEGLYSDFNPASLNLFAIRPYTRPLAQSGIPIVRTFEIGGQYILDKDQTAIPTSDSTSTTYQYTQDGVSAFGLDAGITLLSIPFIQIDLFTTYSKLNVANQAVKDTLGDGFSSGSGFSTGLNFRLNFIADLFSTDIRIERLNYTENYLPQFFDASYEINKDAKILSLNGAPKMSGIYGSLQGHIAHKVQLGGSLMIPDEISDEAPAVVRLNADLERLGDKVSLHANYIKGNLATLKDAFTFDENSLAKVRFIYHMNKFLAVGMDYYWAFAPADDGSYKATRYMSPYFGLSIDF
tara:strand:- start:10120 stop:11835 length:1716 start_codon:yes stop_codon:yes gene_type:complete